MHLFAIPMPNGLSVCMRGHITMGTHVICPRCEENERREKRRQDELKTKQEKLNAHGRQ